MAKQFRAQQGFKRCKSSGDENSEVGKKRKAPNAHSSYQRQRRQVANGNESLVVLTDDNGDEETDNDLLKIEEQIEDDLEASDRDLDGDLGVCGPSAVATSSFRKHIEYKLSKLEAEDLAKTKWKYMWELPCADIPNCKWVGTGECFIKHADKNSSLGLKQKLYEHWLDIYKRSGGNDLHSSRQGRFFSLCNSYRDILHCEKKPFYQKGLKEDTDIMDAYLMHSLNHIFRSRDLMRKNDEKISKHKEGTKEEVLLGDGFLDQGFTRPKVLILLPLRSIALRVIERLIQLTPATSKVNVEHLDRFYLDFGSEKDDNPQKPQKRPKPCDHQLLFEGNTNDAFMIGIKFTRKSIKLYGDFYSSDVIVASPVQLKMKLDNKDLDTDYLSSIEVVIIDHADVISMQNWSFLTYVVEHLNRIPLKQHGTNVMRIRQWYLDGFARFYRQTIILGYHSNPDMNALFNNHCVNYEGKVKSVRQHDGVLPKVLSQVRQIYERFDTDSIADVDAARLEYFSKKVFPRIKDSEQGGIMLFVSSYLEIVPLRRFLESQNASFYSVHENVELKEISDERRNFFKGMNKIVLYTERNHFYRRYKFRGIRNLIIYSLPERKEFYPEIVNMLDGSDDMACTVLFSPFDKLRLERIVGSAHARRMVKSKKGVFVFC